MVFEKVEIGGGRVARMYQLKPEVLERRGTVQIRPGVDPAVVLGQRWSTRLTELGIIAEDKLNVFMFSGPEPHTFNYRVFDREEFFVLNSEGLVRKTGEGQGEIVCVNRSVAITTGRLADYQYFDSMYGEYHSQVADAIRSLMSGDVANWNSFRQEIRAIERPHYHPIPLIDLSGAHFSGLDLHGADLKMLILNWAVFENVNLEGADLSTPDHLCAMADFRNVTTNSRTVMPEFFKR